MRRSERTMARVTATAAACLAVALAAGEAHAYCRTSSCNQGSPHTAAVCDPPQPDDCGTPIAWPQSCVSYSVQNNASPLRNISFSQTEQLMATAFATWLAADCAGGGHPNMTVTEFPPAVCDQHEYNMSAGNANIIMFHDDNWPYEGQPGDTLALTTVTYSLDTGQIYDADMELNSADNNFTLGDTNVDFDLLSIVTHESGHFLGMAHSHDPNAVMWPEYVEHTTNLRHLTSDDIAGICAIYPPGEPTSDCDATPRHGFSPCCASQQGSSSMCAVTGATSSGGCCVVAPGNATGGDGRRGPLAAAAALLGALILGGRRRRRK